MTLWNNPWFPLELRKLLITALTKRLKVIYTNNNHKSFKLIRIAVKLV
jgi:hypothetical protein